MRLLDDVDVLDIIDAGGGIEKASMLLIFKPTAAADASSTAVTTCCGLRLLVRSHGYLDIALEVAEREISSRCGDIVPSAILLYPLQE